MKRRTFLQTVIGAIAALFGAKALPETPEPQGIDFTPPGPNLRWRNFTCEYSDPSLKGMEIHPGEIIRIKVLPNPSNPSAPKFHTRTVRYVGETVCHKGDPVCYVEGTAYIAVKKVDLLFDADGIVEGFRLPKRVTFNGTPMFYKETLDA